MKFNLKQERFNSVITDYLDSLSYSKGSSSSIFKHQISLKSLIERIISLKETTNPINLEKLKIEFNTLIDKNTIDANTWIWKFELEEWDAQYSQEDNKFTFEKVLESEEINIISKIKSNRLKEHLSKKILSLTPKEFEDFVGEFFGKQPWIDSIEVTQYSQDRGVDFRGNLTAPGISVPYKFVGQAKHMKSKVGGPDMRNFLGAIGQLPPGSIGYFVSTGGFNPEAIETSETWPQHRIELYDLNRMIDMMINDQIGLRSSAQNLMEMDPEFWSFTDDD